MVNNCGKKFHLEVCSREFETELRRLVTSKVPKVSERTRQLIRKWAKDFKNDPQLSLMPALYSKLKQEGVCFKSSEPKRTRSISDAVLKNPDAVSSAQEEEDIAKAIELSLRDTSGKNSSNALSTLIGSINTTKQSNVQSLYPSFDSSNSNGTVTTNSTTTNKGLNSASTQQNLLSQPPKDPLKVRALYDFEAAEDNELTFKAGEIILVLDNSDQNWWKGSNHRGEGLFPANFVTTDLTAETESISKSSKLFYIYKLIMLIYYFFIFFHLKINLRKKFNSMKRSR